ncbi:uncharacterized protein NEMAJ01_2016 [Nematocida major]|uniref:uncharacterized protein n=1 Tax=Nematocida major TaxID=1912982 RepID=UPI002008338B|nr:uncharacterized protein NEMAJ01_2016 [Nematocida major]KAH9387120.1 hypothetical protein NEMAJ01_2016 [Nematocida major]
MKKSGITGRVLQLFYEWTKFLALGVLFAQLLWARLPLEDLISMYTEDFVDTTNTCITISPHAPINQVSGNIIAELQFLRNMRFFSNAVHSFCALEQCGPPDQNGNHTYAYKRDASKDTAVRMPNDPSISQVEQGIEEYTADCYENLIRMFPSVDGHTLSIETDRKGSFTNFLREVCTQEQAHSILAVLLLLSYGVFVPIHIYQDPAGQENCRASTEIRLFGETLIKGASWFLLEPTQVICFFTKYRTRKNMSLTMGMYLQGDFLCSPQVFILAYISHYISRKEVALGFVTCVHKILSRLKACLDTRAEKILKQWFSLPEERISTVQAVKSFEIVREGLKRLSWFPFTDQALLPSYMSVSCYNRATQEFSAEKFVNSVETAVMVLFCCFLYNPKTMQYDMGEMLQGEKENAAFHGIKKFFTGGNGFCPRKCCTTGTFNHWNQVVSDLPYAEIRYYRKNRNQLASGIMNVLSVIAHLTGTRGSAEFAQIKELITNIYKYPGILYKNYMQLEKYIKELFALVSTNKHLEVRLEDIAVKSAQNEAPDLYGYVTLWYGNKGCVEAQGVRLNFIPGFVAIDLLPVSIPFSQTEAADLAYLTKHIRSQQGFSSCLLAHYISQKLPGSGPMHIKKSLPIDAPGGALGAVRKALQDSRSGLDNSIHMAYFNWSNQLKRDFITMLCLWAKERNLKLTKHDKIARIISNIVLSVPLDEPRMQCDFFCPLMFTGQLGCLHPAFYIPKNIYVWWFKTAYTTLKRGCSIYPEYPGLKTALLGYFAMYRAETGESLSSCELLTCPRHFYEMFDCLFADNTVQGAETLTRMLLEEMRDLGERRAALLINTLNLIWFGLALLRKLDHHRLVMHLYNTIDPSASYMRSHPMLANNDIWNRQKITLILQKLKRLLCARGEEKKFECIFGMFKQCM